MLTGLTFTGRIGFGFAIGEPLLETFDMALCFPIGSEEYC